MHFENELTHAEANIEGMPKFCGIRGLESLATGWK